MVRDSNGHFDFLFKLVVVGDSGVGKSNLISRFNKKGLIVRSYPTIGVEFSSPNISVDGKIIKAQIWDTAGHESYQLITSAYWRATSGALIVYDITQKSTFENVERWLKKIRDHTDGNTVVILAGNKVDLAHERSVSVDEANAFSEKENLLYMETSAFDLINIDKVFIELVTRCYRVVKRRNEPDTTSGPVSQPKRKTISNDEQGKDDHEQLHETHPNKTRTVIGETGTSSTKRVPASCHDQEFAELKEKLEAVQIQNIEVLARETERDKKLESLQTSMDSLRSTMENSLAQQQVVGATTPTCEKKDAIAIGPSKLIPLEPPMPSPMVGGLITDLGQPPMVFVVAIVFPMWKKMVGFAVIPMAMIRYVFTFIYIPKYVKTRFS